MLSDINKILSEQYKRAYDLLKNNKNKLDYLAKELFERKSITGVEVERLLKNIKD